MKTFSFVKICLFAIVFLTSCGSGETLDTSETPDVPEKPELIVSDSDEIYFSKGVLLDAEATEQEINFSTNLDWSISVSAAEGDANWCTVSPMAGKPGAIKILIQVMPNDTYDERSLTIVIQAGLIEKTIQVTQKAKYGDANGTGTDFPWGK